MQSEKEKMLAGELYTPFEAGLTAERAVAKEKIYDYNQLRPFQIEERKQIIRGLFGSAGKEFNIEQPFYCDYGYNIHVGENFYANFGCTILDGAPVRIGDDVLLAPNVSIYTAGHPLEPGPRQAAIEYAYPVTIGNNVWIGGDVVILPGVTIGDNTVIGAASVVTKNIPAGVLAVGNPCRVIRKIV